MPSTEISYGEFFEKLCECNAQLFKTFQEKSTVDNPLHKAMLQVNAKDLGTFMDEASRQPTKVMQTQMKWWQDQMQIWQSSFLKASDPEIGDVIEPEKGDKRFKDPMWSEDAMFDVIKQSYLLLANNMLDMIKNTAGLDDDVKARLTFFTRQMVNAVAPTNFIATNPELLRLTMEQNGANLIKGMEQLQEDLQTSAEVLRVRMTNKDAFDVGKDLASTPGEVVFRNELLELIQYHPKTDKVKLRPMLIVPPFINKYYILDLRQKNSLVNWLVEQGHTVFLISWRNPDVSMAEVGFQDYVTQGIIEPLEKIEQLTGEAHVNALGYCIGGTLLSIAMAYMVSKRMKQRIKSATLLTTILDFSQPGEIGVFINEPIVSALEMQNNAMGFMDGRALGVSFSFLRENSLYWNYYVDNYLKGLSPVDFDLLHWNNDSTNVTAACHNFIIRELYLENKLTTPKEIKIHGTGIDLSKVKTPCYFLSTREDHIAEWKTTYKGSHLLSANVTFVLGESGHVAGVVNPPAKEKYGYWEGGKRVLDSDEWFNTAEHHEGSWWLHWAEWLNKQDEKSEDVEARQIDKANSLQAAPGSYVLQQLPIMPVTADAEEAETA